MNTETYRSGHNGADSKSVYQFMLVQGFESLRLRYLEIPCFQGISFIYGDLCCIIHNIAGPLLLLQYLPKHRVHQYKLFI